MLITNSDGSTPIECQRYWHRVKYQEPMVLIIENDTLLQGSSLDVSMNGVFLLIDTFPSEDIIGKPGQLKVSVTEGDMDFTCRVVRTTTEGIGIHFEYDQTAFGMFINHNLTLSLLSEINNIFSETLDLESTLDIAVSHIKDFMNTEGASLFLVNDDDKIECFACSGPVDIKGMTLDKGEGIIGETISSGLAQIVNNTANDPHFASKVDAATGFSTNSIIAAPLKIQGKTFGALEVVNMRGHDLFPGHDRAVLSTLASSTAMAIHTAQQSSRLIEQENAIRQSEAENLAKSSFLANMSHELRTPLTAIIGSSEHLLENGFCSRDQDKQNKVKEIIETIESAGRSQLALVNDILDMSKIESGKFTIDERAYDLDLLVRNVQKMLDIRAHKAGIEFVVENRNRGPYQLMGDEQRISQILVNLLGNAIKFTEKGRVALTTWSDQNHLFFDVEDTGIGMSEETVKRVFQRFEQADSSSTKRFGGSGLGLYISINLAELMGGTIEASSIEGEGSRFLLRLPYRQSDIPTHQKSHGEQRQSSSSVSREKLSGHVLIAEDTPELQLLERRILESMGITVTTVNDGKEAVELATTHPFDLILMDMQMPVMDGLEATKLLRARGHSNPIVALTANVMQQHRDQFDEAGCDHFLAKPIDKHELQRVLQHYLSR